MTPLLATKPADYYLAPTAEEMQDYLRIHGLGELTDVETGLAANHAASHQLREAPIQKGFLDPSNTSDPIKAKTMQQLLESIHFDTLTGKNPTEKAAAFAAAIRSEQGGMEEIVKQVKNGKDVGDIADKINKKLEGIHEMSKNDFAKDMMDIGDIPEVKLATLSPEDKAVMMAMAQIEKLGFIKAIKRTAPIEDLEGKIIKPSDMLMHEQLPELWNPELIVDPQFDIRFLTMEMDVETRYKRHDIKQVIDLLIDRSYSMLDVTPDGVPWKQGFVRAVLLFYFDLVKKGTTSLYVSTFERENDGHVRIETELEARDYYKNYQCKGGGTTDVNKVIQQDQKSISQNRLGQYTFHMDSAPEVVIINDGQDHVDKSMELIAPMHAITLEESNEGLKTLCERSGGSYTEFDSPHRRRRL